MRTLPSLFTSLRSAAPTVVAGLIVVAGLVAAAARPAPAMAVAIVPAGFTDVVVADTLPFPVGMAFLPDGRLLVTECKTARLKVIANGLVGDLGGPDSVDASTEEEGLLGVAVDPGWPARPYVYLFHDALDAHVWIARYNVTGDLSDGTSTNLVMWPGTRHLILRDIPDMLFNHNGGTVRFGPDGMLWTALAEDANACTAQDTVSLRGVILRMDVSGLPDGPGIADKAAITPPDNPFASHPHPNARLVWAIGLRNPFRFHIDPADGALYIGDVGHVLREEISVCDAPAMNFGWPFFEGTAVPFVNPCGGAMPPGLTFPIYEYPNPPAALASVIAGPVYRSPGGACAFPAEYEGDLFVVDHYEGVLRRLEKTAGSWAIADSVPGQPSATDWARSVGRVADFAIGPDGALWFLHYGTNFTNKTGQVRRICYTGPAGVVPRADTRHAVFAAPWPSPAYASVHLSYTLARAARVTLAVYDPAGRLVQRLVDGTLENAGVRTRTWDGRTTTGGRAPAGLYLARLVVDGESHERRFPLVR